MDTVKQLINDEGKYIGDRVTSFPDPMTEEGYHFPAHKLGAKMFADVRLPDGMSMADKGRMQDLARYDMIASANMLGYRQGKNLKAYSYREIGNLVDLHSRDKCYQFMSRMLRLRVIQRVNTTSGAQFYVNPAYYMANGQRLSLNLFLLFKDELLPLIPEWVIDEFLSMANYKDQKAMGV